MEAFNYILKDMLTRYKEHQVFHISGSLAYFFTLAIFPLFIFIQALLGLFNVGLVGFLGTLQQVVPTSVYDLLQSYIQSISGNNIGLLSFGLISALYAASIAVNSIMNAVLLSRNQTNKRKWHINKLLAIMFTIMIGASLSLFLIIPVLGSLLQSFLSQYLPEFLPMFDLLSTLSWLISAVAIISTLALLYKIVPQKTEKLTIWPGAFFALIGWIIGSLGFAFYVNNFANYSTYGFFGSIMVFLLWLYITGLMIILGAELNDSIDQYKDHCLQEELGAKQKESK
jgi:membrane protein